MQAFDLASLTAEEWRGLLSDEMEDPRPLRRQRSQPTYVQRQSIRRDGPTSLASITLPRDRRNILADLISSLPSHQVYASHKGLTLSRSLTTKNDYSKRVNLRRKLTTSASLPYHPTVRFSDTAEEIATTSDAIDVAFSDVFLVVDDFAGNEVDDEMAIMLNEELQEADEEELWWRRRSVKDMPNSMPVKRRYRDRVRKYQTRSQSAIYTVMQHRRQSWYKFKQNVKEVVSQVGVWSKSFKVIEGHFGTAILSYFHFVRWLMFLNLFIAILMFIFITVPYLVLQSHSTYEAYTKEAKLPPTIQLNEAIECSQNYTKAIEKDGDLWKGITYLLDFLQGTGFMERTVLFYGVYFNKTYTIHDVTHTYNMSLAYILVTAAYFLISFVLIVKNSAEGLKATQIVHEGAVVHYCNKVFGGWDYCITNAKSAKLKHKNIHHEFEVDLNEQTLAIERKGRSTLRWAKLYFVRLAVNVIVLVLLIGALSLIFFTNEWSMQLLVKDEVKNNKPLLLLVEFLPSITISVLNIIIPEIFGVIVKPEDYSPSFEVYITLIRTVFLRLASIGILMISLYVRLVDGDVTRQSLLEITGRNETFIPTCGNKDFDEIKCWETYIGQQLYKLVLLDFLVIVFVTFLVEFPRQFIYTKLHKRIGLIEKIGQQEFDLPKNVLEIVYSQVLCWLGAFFSPLIPVMCFMKCFFFFYVKKLSLLTNCQPPNRPYRASKANAFFMGILLISFILAALPIGYTIGRIPPSKSCGPFRLYSSEEFTIFDTITNMLLGWPDVLRDIFFVLGSPAFFVPAVLILCLVMYYYWAVAQGHKRMAKILRNQLASEGRDKQFLLSRVSAALRRRDRGRS